MSFPTLFKWCKIILQSTGTTPSRLRPLAVALLLPWAFSACGDDEDTREPPVEADGSVEADADTDSTEGEETGGDDDGDEEVEEEGSGGGEAPEVDGSVD